MDRQGYYDNQLVDPPDLNTLQDHVEKAEKNLALDHVGQGITTGLTLVQSTPTPGISCLLTPGSGRDNLGRRLEVVSNQAIDLTTDSSAVSTAVSSGNERWIVVALQFARTEEEPYSDPIGGDGFFLQRETFTIVKVMGAQAAIGTASLPAFPANSLVIGAVIRTFGQTQFLTRHFMSAAGDIYPGSKRLGDLWSESLARIFEVRATPAASMAVRVRPGRAIVDDIAVYNSGDQTTATITAPTSNPRIDLVYLTADGSSTGIRAGGEAPSPERPTTAGVLPLAFLHLAPGQLAIEASHIEDARGWLRAVTSVARVFTFVASGGETEVDLPFNITPGSGGVTVELNGDVLRPDQYSEATDAVILGSALSGGDHVVVRALNEAPLGIPAAHASSHGPNGADPLASLELTQLADDLSGMMVGGHSLFTPLADGTRKQITVSAIRFVVIGKKSLSAGETTINESQLEAGGSYTADTWYYVYAYNNAGTLAFQISTTVPDAGRSWKNGTTTHRYLGCVRSNGSGEILPFRMHHGEYLYRPSGIGQATFDTLPVGAATTYTDSSFAAFMPPHTRHLKMLIQFAAGNGADVKLYLKTKGDSNDLLILSHHGSSASDALTMPYEIETDGNQKIQYKTDVGAAALEFYATGFRE